MGPARDFAAEAIVTFALMPAITGRRHPHSGPPAGRSKPSQGHQTDEPHRTMGPAGGPCLIAPVIGDTLPSPPADTG